MFVSEPWHSLIDPNLIDLPPESSSYEEMLDGHLYRNGKKISNEESYKDALQNLNEQDKKIL